MDDGKNQINKEHPRIKNRTLEQQDRRDRLADTLKLNRKKGNLGKMLAKSLRKEVQASKDYILDEYGFSKKGIIELLKNGYDIYLDHARWKERMNKAYEMGLLDNDLANQIIAEGKFNFFEGYEERFHGLDFKKELVNEKNIFYIIQYVNEPINEDVFNRVLSDAINQLGKHNTGLLDFLLNNISKFEKISLSTYERLIHIKWPCLTYDITKNFNRFEGLSLDKFADDLSASEKHLSRGNRLVFLEYYDFFKSLGDKKIILLTLRNLPISNSWVMTDFHELLKKADGLDNIVALKIIEKGDPYLTKFVLDNANKFKGLDLNEDLFLDVLKQLKPHFFTSRYINQFHGLDKKAGLALLISAEWEIFLENPNKFKGLDLNKETFLEIYKNGNKHGLLKHINQFHGLDEEIGQMLIKDGYDDIVSINLSMFKD